MRASGPLPVSGHTTPTLITLNRETASTGSTNMDSMKLIFSDSLTDAPDWRLHTWLSLNMMVREMLCTSTSTSTSIPSVLFGTAVWICLLFAPLTPGPRLLDDEPPMKPGFLAPSLYQNHDSRAPMVSQWMTEYSEISKIYRNHVEALLVVFGFAWTCGPLVAAWEREWLHQDLHTLLPEKLDSLDAKVLPEMFNLKRTILVWRFGLFILIGVKGRAGHVLMGWRVIVCQVFLGNILYSYELTMFWRTVEMPPNIWWSKILFVSSIIILIVVVERVGVVSFLICWGSMNSALVKRSPCVFGLGDWRWFTTRCSRINKVHHRIRTGQFSTCLTVTISTRRIPALLACWASFDELSNQLFRYTICHDER